MSREQRKNKLVCLVANKEWSLRKEQKSIIQDVGE